MENNKTFLGTVLVAIAAIIAVGYVAVTNKTVERVEVRDGGNIGSALTYSSGLSRIETFNQFADIIRDIKGSTYSGSWDPGAVASTTVATTSVTVSGAALGDYVQVSFDSATSTDAWKISGKVSAANTVMVLMESAYNNGLASLNLATSTLRIRVASSTILSSISASP